MTKPTLSIILPIYNGESFIKETLESIMKQENNPFEVEIIAIDDGSTDNSQNILKLQQEIYGAIKVITLPSNQGPAKARKIGITQASGKWLAFIDQDDCWAKNKLHCQYNFLLKNPTYHYVLANQCFKLYQITKKPSWVKQEWLDKPQKGYVFGTLLISKKCFCDVGFDEDQNHGVDDVKWFIDANQQKVKGHMLDDVLLYRKISSQNLSAKTKKHNENLLRIIRQKINEQAKSECLA
jgi:glycosyltransferase involved in cell wall biosynthesis